MYGGTWRSRRTLGISLGPEERPCSQTSRHQSISSFWITGTSRLRTLAPGQAVTSSLLTATEVDSDVSVTVAMQRLLNVSGLKLTGQLTIWCDNLQTIRLVSSDLPRLRTALRHVDIHQCWIREMVQKGTLAMQYIRIADMPADGMTKAKPSF